MRHITRIASIPTSNCIYAPPQPPLHADLASPFPISSQLRANPTHADASLGPKEPYFFVRQVSLRQRANEDERSGAALENNPLGYITHQYTRDIHPLFSHGLPLKCIMCLYKHMHTFTHMYLPSNSAILVCSLARIKVYSRFSLYIHVRSVPCQ